MEKRIFTAPNLLSLFRIILIFPLIYALTDNRNRAAIAVFLLSGLTDIADGFIARHFNMVSDLGKILDPTADKLTQGALLLCLAARYKQLLPLFVLLIVKETILGVMGFIAVGSTGTVNSAAIHGKLAAAMLYMTIGIHMLLPQLGEVMSVALILATACAMIISFILYARQNIVQIKRGRGEQQSAF